jgi:hypothetical protein
MRFATYYLLLVHKKVAEFKIEKQDVSNAFKHVYGRNHEWHVGASADVALWNTKLIKTICKNSSSIPDLNSTR